MILTGTPELEEKLAAIARLTVPDPPPHRDCHTVASTFATDFKFRQANDHTLDPDPLPIP